MSHRLRADQILHMFEESDNEEVGSISSDELDDEIEVNDEYSSEMGTSDDTDEETFTSAKITNTSTTAMLRSETFDVDKARSSLNELIGLVSSSSVAVEVDSYYPIETITPTLINRMFGFFIFIYITYFT